MLRNAWNFHKITRIVNIITSGLFMSCFVLKLENFACIKSMKFEMKTAVQNGKCAVGLCLSKDVKLLHKA